MRMTNIQQTSLRYEAFSMSQTLSLKLFSIKIRSSLFSSYRRVKSQHRSSNSGCWKVNKFNEINFVHNQTTRIRAQFEGESFLTFFSVLFVIIITAEFIWESFQLFFYFFAKKNERSLLRVKLENQAKSGKSQASHSIIFPAKKLKRQTKLNFQIFSRRMKMKKFCNEKEISLGFI